MARRKVTTAPVLASWAETDKALRDIRECRHTLAELAVDLVQIFQSSLLK